MIDPKLLEYASTDRQREILQAVIDHGGQSAAARALGVHRNAVDEKVAIAKKRAAAHGWSPEHDMTRTVPDGFKLKGTSTLYDDAGNQRLQWVKSTADQEAQAEMQRQFVQALAEDVRGMAEPLPAPKGPLDEDTLTAYVVGDMHIGLYAYGEETGADDFDSDIATAQVKAAVDYLVSASPASAQGMLVNVGDALHIDSRANVTPASGNLLDVDTRYSRLTRMCVFALRHCVERMLQKHSIVHIVNAQGNHDPDSAGWISLCLSAFYEREPRVQVDMTPNKFHYHTFGKNLIGITHGDKLKHDDLPAIMAAARPREWGEAEHRYWWTGHIHHKRQTEYRGCVVESFNTLAAPDAWHSASGYIAKREMQSLVLHREHGLIARSICPIGVVKEKSA